jgi:hypothetical protein
MEYFVLIIIYFSLYFTEDLSKMEYFVLIIIYFTLYFREDLSKMEYFVLIIVYFTLYFREDLSKMEYFVLIIIRFTLYFREDLSKMEYLGCCFKEALRLHSPVPFIMKQITKEAEIDGIKFLVGSRFTVHLYNLHHNPHVEDSMEYRQILT